MTAGATVTRARAAFAKDFPEIMAGLGSAGAPLATVVIEQGQAIDIKVGEKRLYGGDARRFAADQVAAFMHKPLRLFMEQPSAAGLVSDICEQMVEAITATLADYGMDEIRRHPVGNPTFLIVFGLGLGYHLIELAHRTKARWLILVEPSLEFVESSLQALDWSALLEHFEAIGGGVSLVTETEPERMVGAIVAEVARRGVPYIDGAWVFTHYPLRSFAEARTRLHDAMQYAFVNRGFFEDEITMMTNAVANFTAAPFRLLEGKARLQRPETAVIVGAGPSLDESIETLHRIRDRIVLFSGGTALRPLLRNGLTPDFHCELENVPAVVDVLSEAAKYGALSRIRLIASATVDPRVPPLFGESFFFFRDSVSSTMLLGSRFRTLQGAAPTCVNTAMSAAVSLGFTEFLLFGTDCGIRPGGHHHASDTVYRDVGLYKEAADRKARYPLEVEGNFGGIAHSDWVYDACRRMLGELIRVYGLSPINCSDGARIPGARPMVPESVEIEGPAVDRAALITALEQAMPRFLPGELLREGNFAAMIAETRKLYREIGGIFDLFKDARVDFAGVYDAFKDFLATAEEIYSGADAMANGTLFALPRIGMFYGYRVEEGEVRRRLFEVYRREMRATLRDMEKRSIALFERLSVQAEGAAPLAAPAA